MGRDYQAMAWVFLADLAGLRYTFAVAGSPGEPRGPALVSGKQARCTSSRR
jgi:hypothetical protein